MIEEIFTDLAPLTDKRGVTLTAEGDGVMTGSDALIYRLLSVSYTHLPHPQPDPAAVHPAGCVADLRRPDL